MSFLLFFTPACLASPKSPGADGACASKCLLKLGGLCGISVQKAECRWARALKAKGSWAGPRQHLEGNLLPEMCSTLFLAPR